MSWSGSAIVAVVDDEEPEPDIISLRWGGGGSKI
jgi:hypothetical protein